MRGDFLVSLNLCVFENSIIIDGMIDKLISAAEKTKISVLGWMAGFVGVVFIRFILEFVSSPSNSGYMTVDGGTLVHYGLFYLAVALGLFLVVNFFTGGRGSEMNVLFFGLPIIWLPPLLDLLVSGGAGAKMMYIFKAPRELLYSFLSFFGFSNGVTFGMRIEIFLILLFIGYYVWTKRKSISATIGSMIFSYILIFILGSFPSIIYLMAGSSVYEGANGLGVSGYIEKTIDGSLIPGNALSGALSAKTYTGAYELGFNKFSSQILFLVSMAFFLIIFWKEQRNKFLAVLKNSRFERLAFYISLIGVGVLIAATNGTIKNFSWVDILGILSLVFSWISACFFAIHVNDKEDISIDAISNPSRPLISGEMSSEEMKELGYIWLVISLLGAYSVGYYPFFMILVFTSAYYVYSANPYRLKRIPVLSSFLISVACLSSVFAGFFWISDDKKFSAFPALLIYGIIIMMTLASNARDIKDVEGDRANGIATLPVILGVHGVRITGALLGLGFLLVPIFFSNYYLYVFAFPAGILAYVFATKKPYKEIYIFLLFFVFLLLCLLVAWAV